MSRDLGAGILGFFITIGLVVIVIMVVTYQILILTCRDTENKKGEIIYIDSIKYEIKSDVEYLDNNRQLILKPLNDE